MTDEQGQLSIDQRQALEQHCRMRGARQGRLKLAILAALAEIDRLDAARRQQEVANEVNEGLRVAIDRLRAELAEAKAAPPRPGGGIACPHCGNAEFDVDTTSATMGDEEESRFYVAECLTCHACGPWCRSEEAARESMRDSGAAPPRPAAIVRTTPNHYHAFESGDDGQDFWLANQGGPVPVGSLLCLVKSWTWHPREEGARGPTE